MMATNGGIKRQAVTNGAVRLDEDADAANSRESGTTSRVLVTSVFDEPMKDSSLLEETLKKSAQRPAAAAICIT